MIKKTGITNNAIRKYTMLIALAVVFVVFAIATEGRLLVPQNLSNLLLQNSYVLIMACGMLLCILTGGNVDLSVGSTVCLVGAVAAQLMAAGVNALIVIPLCIVISLLIGIWQGFWIGHVHVPPFICTLAGMFLFRGLGRAILGSKTVTVENNTFFDIFTAYLNIPSLDSGDVKWSAFLLGCIVSAAIAAKAVLDHKRKGQKGYKQEPIVHIVLRSSLIILLILAYTWQLAHYRGVSVMALWVIAVILVYSYITSSTAIGRYFYAVGGNEKAASLSGIDTKKVYFLAYVSMSVLAGLSGLMVIARIGSVNSDTGSSFEMDAIGACFIGGASAYGGSGNIRGVIIGAILLGVINQGMSIMGINNNFQYVIKGAVLLTAVIFDVLSNRKSGKA